MEKQLIIDRLQATIDMLKSLTPQSFNYGNWVSESDADGKCGTVCCAAGWYPKYFPEAGLKWKSSYDHRTGKPYVYLTNPVIGIDGALMDWHGISRYVMNALFYGCSLYAWGGKEFLPNWQSTLETRMLAEAIARFETVLQFIKDDKIS